MGFGGAGLPTRGGKRGPFRPEGAGIIGESISLDAIGDNWAAFMRSLAFIYKIAG